MQVSKGYQLWLGFPAKALIETPDINTIVLQMLRDKFI